MKRSFKKIMSLLLAVVLTVSLSTMAFAATTTWPGTVNSVIIDKTSLAGKGTTEADPYVMNYGDALDLNATVDYTATTGTSMPGNIADWTSSDEAVATVNATTGVITTKGVGVTAIKAAVTASNGTKDDTVYIKILPKVTLSPTTMTVCVGGQKTLTATAQPAMSGGTYTYAWSNTAGVTQTNTGASATVTGAAVGSGTVSVTATYTDAASKAYVSDAASCNVTVVSKATAVEIHNASGAKVTSVTMNTSTMQLSGVTTPADAAQGGTFSWVSDKPGVATVDANGLVTAVSTGTANISCTFNDGGNTPLTATCAVTASYNAAKAVGDTQVSAVYGRDTAMTDASNGISAKFSGSYTTAPSANAKITFTGITGSSGTLYSNSAKTAPVTTGTPYLFNTLSSMVFTPNAKGNTVYSYTLDDYPNQITGTLTVAVTTASSAVTVYLDNSDPYYFTSNTTANSASAYTLIANAVYGASGQNYSYIQFGADNNYAGTLYSGYSGQAVTPQMAFYYSTSGTNSVAGLYFVPYCAGTYSRAFTAYDGAGNAIASGTLNLVVPDKINGDVNYSVPLSSTLMLDEADFTNWFRAQTGQNYYLSGVEFTGVTYSNASYPGYFQHNGQSFTPGNGAVYYTNTYTGTANATQTYLGRIKYNSPAMTNTLVVSFTCYGGMYTDSRNLTRTGKMYISVTNNNVRSVNYDVSYGTSKTLNASDFIDVYSAAMNTTGAGSFYIQFTSAPTMGNMYLGYYSAPLNATTVRSYNLRVNYNGSGYSVGEVMYVPGSSTGGTDSVTYAAYSTGGSLLYTGTVNFRYGSSAGNVCYSDGHTFSESDFYGSANTSSLNSVVFGQPSSGKLYYNYAYGSGSPVTNTMRFYTRYAAYGTYPVSAVTYIPAVGFNGSVTIPYTATNSNGGTVSGSVVLTVRTKTASTYYGDVTYYNTGNWSANSVDYAGKWKLMDGTSAGRFSPTTGMTRAMLVTVLYRAAGSPGVYGGCPFTDVKSGDYYYAPVSWAYSNGIVNGMTATSFAPNSNVTREQIATILYKYAAKAGKTLYTGSGMYNYRDAGAVSPYAQTAMNWAVYNGIITGTNYNTLSPQSNATRAQVAVMLHRFMLM